MDPFATVVIPTRERPDLLQKCLNSFFNMTNYGHAELILRIDDDDPVTLNVIQQYQHDYPSQMIKVIIGPRKDGYGSLGDFFNESAVHAHGRILVSLNDDAIFKTSGWAERLYEVSLDYPDHIFDLGVETVINPDAYPWCIVHRSWFERLGYWHHPKLLYGDVFIRDVVKEFDRAISVRDVIIEHEWASHRRQQATEVECRVVNESYWSLHRHCVQDTVNKLRHYFKR